MAIGLYSAGFGKSVMTWSRSALAFLQRRPSPAFLALDPGESPL
jgi:hypothetical protein